MKKEKLDEFHYHEALDRTSMICDVLSDQVMGHPVFQQNKYLKDELELAINTLYAVYCEIGKLMIDKFDKE